MTGLLLDTHIWFWYLAGADRLPGRIRDAVDTSLDACWLSPISVWELGMLTARGRVSLRGEFRDWVAHAWRHMPLHEASVTTEVALKSGEVELPHRDPADRFLAATALVYELTLVTVDRRLSRARWLKTLS